MATAHPVAPFQGFACGGNGLPGRCPGLVCASLSGSNARLQGTHHRVGNLKVELLIGLFLIATATGVIVTWIGKSREKNARTQSVNNLKQIGLGAQSFHDGNKRLPFNGSDHAVAGRIYKAEAELHNTPLTGSWGFQILPYMNSYMHLWEKVRELDNICYACPGRGRPSQELGKGVWIDYFINNYVNNPENAETPDNGDVKRKLDDITDGTANTIFAGHGNISTRDYTKHEGVVGSSNIFLGGTFGTARAGPNWVRDQPLNVQLRRDTAEPPDIAAGGWGGPFSQGGLFVFCDGTVRVIQYSTSSHIFGAFLTPTGNERVELPD